LRVLVNCTSCVVGGGVRVSASFVAQCINSPSSDEFFFLLSPQVFSLVKPLLCISRFKYSVFTKRPSNLFLWPYLQFRCSQLEKAFSPDIVYTIFGPSYLRFKAPHLCGFADPWVTHPSLLAYSKLPFIVFLLTFLRSFYKRLHLSSDMYYLVESLVCKDGLIERCGVKPSLVYVLSNSYNTPLTPQHQLFAHLSLPSSSSLVITLAHPYLHKNLLEVCHVAKEVNYSSPSPVIFLVTIPFNSPFLKRFDRLAGSLGASKYIRNLGRLTPAESYSYLRSSDISYLPTLLESFSSVYVDSMSASVPIVTPSLNFAKDTCGNAAYFYTPDSPSAAAKAILDILNDSDLRERLINFGQEKLSEYPDHASKFHLTMRLLLSILTNSTSKE